MVEQRRAFERERDQQQQDQGGERGVGEARQQFLLAGEAEQVVAARPGREQHRRADAAALDAFLDGRKVAALTNAGSSLKLCLVAAGEADLYPRLGRTMEWDIAAGHAVLAAAGGRVQTLAGAPLRYGKPGLDNPHFVASGLD